MFLHPYRKKSSFISITLINSRLKKKLKIILNSIRNASEEGEKSIVLNFIVINHTIRVELVAQWQVFFVLSVAMQKITLIYTFTGIYKNNKKITYQEMVILLIKQEFNQINDCKETLLFVNSKMKKSINSHQFHKTQSIKPLPIR